MTKNYKTYRIEDYGNWLRYLIEAETAEGKAQGVADFKSEYMMHDARVEHETGTTAVVRRFYRL
jgi:hypothetical protein